MPYTFLRGFIGAFCVIFAYPFGRSVIRLRRGQERQSRTLAWALRTFVCGAAVAFRAGFDLTTILVYALAALAFLAGVYNEWRPKHEEDLTGQIFPPK